MEAYLDLRAARKNLSNIRAASHMPGLNPVVDNGFPGTSRTEGRMHLSGFLTNFLSSAFVRMDFCQFCICPNGFCKFCICTNALL